MNRVLSVRLGLLLVFGVTAVAATPIADRLTFDQSIDSFFAPDNPDLLLLHQSRADFGGDEFVIIAWKQADLIQRTGDRNIPELGLQARERIVALTERLDALQGVDSRRTSSLERFLERYPRSRNTRDTLLALFEGTLIGADQETTAVVVQLLPTDQSPVSRRETIEQIRRIAAELDAAAAVAGEPVQIHDMFRLVQRDGRRLYLVSLAVLTVALLLIFRRLRWIATAIGIVVGSVSCSRAVLVITGVQMSMVSSMLNSLVTVISIATTMHVLVHYRDLRADLAPDAAALRTLRDMRNPVFWTCVTTAIGFLSLLVSDIVPVRRFAVMMALATMIVLLATLMVMPAAMLSGRQVSVPGRAPLERILDRLLNRIVQSLDLRPKRTGMACFLLIVVTAPGLLHLEIDTDFSHNFRKSSPIVQSLQFVESNLGPAGTWEVAFDVPENIDAAFLENTEVLTDRLKQLREEGVQIDVLSLNDAINVPPRNGDARRRLATVTRREPDFVAGLYNDKAHRMRIVLRSREQQPAEAKIREIARVREVVREHFEALGQKQAAGASASGIYILLARLINSLLQDQLNSFLVAAAGILLAMTAAFRSLRIGIVCLLPNVFPVVVVIGGLGMLDMPINIGTAMIASVSLGLTVDSTIHYVTAFQRARRQHRFSESIRIAHSGAGRAVVLSNLALVAGFLVLTASEFVPLVYFGALLSLSMISGMVGGLVLLPLLLRWSSGDRLTPADAEEKSQREESTTPEAG